MSTKKQNNVSNTLAEPTEPEIINPVTLPTKKKRKSPITDKQKASILGLLARNVPKREIARTFMVPQCTVQNIAKRWKHLLGNLDKVQAYSNYRSQILTSAEMSVLERLLDPKTLDKANTYNLTFAFDKLATHNRLEQGKSTTNSEVHTVVSINDLDINKE